MERKEVHALKQPEDNLCDFINSSVSSANSGEISLIFLVVQVPTGGEGRGVVSGTEDELYQEEISN